MNKGLLIVLFIGLAVRLLLIPNPGFEADVAFWKSWSLAAADHGIVWMTQNTNNNYPPAFGYILWIMGKMYALIANPHDFNDYWNAGNFAFLFVSKLISILSDVVIALGIYWLVSRPELLEVEKKGHSPKQPLITDHQQQETKDQRLKTEDQGLNLHHSLPLLAAALYFLHPVAILDGAWWGQVDAFGVVFLLVSLIGVLKKRPGLALFAIVFGFLFKLQNMIYIPILVVYLLRRGGISSLPWMIFGGFVAWIAGIFPLLLSKNIETAIYLLFTNADWFPWLSLHAYNIWWIVAGGNGMGFSDKYLLWGVLTPKMVGLVLFSASYLASLILVVVKPNPKTLFLSLFLVVFSFFMLLTQSHERYIFPAFFFVPLLLPYFFAKDNGKTGRWMIGLLVYLTIFTLTSTLDIHRTMIVNYPHNGLPILSAFKDVSLTIAASYINIGLYLTAFSYAIFTTAVWIYPTVIAIACFGMFMVNRGYLLGGKVPLTKLKMIGWYQEFAGPQYNMSVGSSSDPKSWNRLSTMYFYYPQGIGGHAKSELVYSLKGQFRRLSSDYGVDTEANTKSSVVFQIIGDGKALFTSQTVGRFDMPQHMDVDITGVDELKLVIQPTQDGNTDDHADWLNPVLYK